MAADQSNSEDNNNPVNQEAAADALVLDGWSAHSPGEAEKLFRKAIKAAPEHWRGYYALGGHFLSLDRYDEAAEYLHVAARRAPDEPAVHHAYGVVLFARDEVDASIGAFQHAAKLDPENPLLLRSLAQAYAREGDSLKAVRIFRGLLKSDPGDYETFRALADHMTHIGRFSDLEDLSAEFIERDPSERSAWGHYARSQHLLGRYNVAKAICEHIDRVFPDWAFNAVVLGQVLAKLGIRKRAREQYLRAIDLDPTEAAAHCELGNLLLEDKKNAEGGLRYLEAVDADYRFAGGHSGIGWVFLRTELYDPAAQAFRNALKYDPYLAGGWTGLGIVVLHRNDAFGALFYFSRALARDGSDEIANCGLGDAYVQIGADDLAEPAYRNAVAAAPFSPISLTRLADLLDRTGRAEEAEDVRMRMAGFTAPPSIALVEEIDDGIKEITNLVAQYLGAR